MKRPLALIFAATLVCGCNTPNGIVDPFVGRQTIPPPSTGVASNPPAANPYYPGSAQGGAPSGGGFNANSGANNRYAPPGDSFGYGGMANRSNPTTSGATQLPGGPTAAPASISREPARPAAGGAPVRSANPAERPPASSGASSRAPASAGFQVNNNPRRGLDQATAASVRHTDQAPRDSFSSGTRGEPGRLSPTEKATDIMELPDARPAGKASSGSSGFRPVGSARRASYEEPVDESQADDNARERRSTRREPALAGESPGNFGFDPNYQWLRGKLEYSRIDDRWKLRYIPINGDTDEFGGSVVLLGSRLLEGYKPGEFITVYGSLGDNGSEARGFAPPFQLDRVIRQADEAR